MVVGPDQLPAAPARRGDAAWDIVLLILVAAAFVLGQVVLKWWRCLWRTSLRQQVFLLLGLFCGAFMGGFMVWSFRRPGTDLSLTLLISNCIYLFSSHAIKASVALLFVSFAQIRAYRLLNPLLFVLIGLSFLSNLTVLPLGCRFDDPDACRFDVFAYVQCSSSAVLGIALGTHPIWPLLEARRILRPGHSVILLTVVLVTGLALGGVSIARAASYTVELHRNRPQTGAGSDDNGIADGAKRMHDLCFWLMLETTASIALATLPDFAGAILHHRAARSRRLADGVMTTTTASALHGALLRPDAAGGGLSPLRPTWSERQPLTASPNVSEAAIELALPQSPMSYYSVRSIWSSAPTLVAVPISVTPHGSPTKEPGPKTSGLAGWVWLISARG